MIGMYIVTYPANLMRHLWLVHCGTLRVTNGKGYQVCLFTHYFLRSRPSLILLIILDTGRIKFLCNVFMYLNFSSNSLVR
jgi:hypothetical protein